MPEGLTTDLLSRACRTYLARAYPDGRLPPGKQAFLRMGPGEALEPWLTPPVCQAVPTPDGAGRGWAFRLGCAWYPHLKLQAVYCGTGGWVFGVDTHDGIKLEPGHPDAERLAALQTANRRLKEEVERAWEAEGLVTFQTLLRAGLVGKGGPCRPAASP